MCAAVLPVLLDENWLHVWHFVLDAKLAFLPTMHATNSFPPRGGLRTLHMLERVCRGWHALMLRAGVWRAFYMGMLNVPLAMERPPAWYRLAVMNLYHGGVHRPDFIQLTRPCAPPPKPIHGALSSMLLPTVLLSTMGVDWQYVCETPEGELTPYSWAATSGGPWRRVRKVGKQKFDKAVHADGRAITKAWRTFKQQKQAAAERTARMKRTLTDTTAE